MRASRAEVSASERTALAWNRSNLALLGCGVAVLHGLGRPPVTSGEFIRGCAIIGFAAIAWSLGLWKLRRDLRRGRERARFGDLWPISFAVALIGVGAFVVAAT